MAPKQAIGDIEGTRTPADLYSLDVILYELLTGRLPYRGEADVLNAVHEGRIERPWQIRKAIPRALESCVPKGDGVKSLNAMRARPT